MLLNNSSIIIALPLISNDSDIIKILIKRIYFNLTRICPPGSAGILPNCTKCEAGTYKSDPKVINCTK